jgi:hypothetical protein
VTADAPHVMDGLLYNESDLPLEEHYTDTHGYTEINFAIPMRMVLEYREADLNGVSEEELQLRYFDPATAEWRTDGIVIEQRDPPNNRITVSIAHLTDFALVGADRKIFLPSISR